VSVHAFRIDWLDKNEEKLFTLLASHDDHRIFGDPLINDILSSQRFTSQLVKRILVCYIFFFLFSHYYFLVVIKSTTGHHDGKLEFMFVWLMIFTCQTYLMYLEYKQLKQKMLRDYLSDFWNLVMLSTNSLIFSIFCCEIF
jgi:hypothetical protein